MREKKFSQRKHIVHTYIFKIMKHMSLNKRVLFVNKLYMQNISRDKKKVLINVMS